MLGAAELLRMSQLDPHQLALLDILNSSIDQMRGVLSNVSERLFAEHEHDRTLGEGVGLGEARQGQG